MDTMSSSSSDGESNERVKNVSNLLVKSNGDRRDSEDGCAYKRRLGDLIFDANFEGGNLGLIERIDEHCYDLMIRPDVTNPRHRLWFNFTVANQRLNQCVILNIVNFSENLSLFHYGLTPCVRCQRRPNWRRLEEDQVFYYKSPNHNNRYVLSIVFRFDSFDNQHQFSLFFPFTPKTLENLITRWQIESRRCIIEKSARQDRKLRLCESTSPVYLLPSRLKTKKLKSRAEFEDVVVATTILSKLVHLLKVTSESNPTKPRVVLTCRPCGNLDSIASYVCHGFLDYILSQDIVATAARNTIDFWVFPMVDPDSICVGNSRTDIMGQAKIGRKLINEDRNIYSNFVAIQEAIAKVVDETQSRAVVIELSSNLNLIGARILGRHFEDNLRMERHLRLPRLISAFAPDFYLENCEFPRRDRESLCISNLDHYRFEVSPFGWFKRSLADGGIVEYDQIGYLRLGKALVCALLELLRPKEMKQPKYVVEYLNSFLPKSDDIDDLTLAQRMA